MNNFERISNDDKIDKFVTKTYIFTSEKNTDENKNASAPLMLTRNIKIIFIIILICFLSVSNQQKYIKNEINANINNFTNSTNSTTNFTNSTKYINNTNTNNINNKNNANNTNDKNNKNNINNVNNTNNPNNTNNKNNTNNTNKNIKDMNNTNIYNYTYLNYISNENTTFIKPISLYNPEIYSKSQKNFIQNIIMIEKLKNQFDVAKNHGIYGFGIYYYFEPEKETFNNPLDIIIENKNLDILFLLIYREKDENKANLKLNDQKKFILDITKYIIDPRYIRINKKPIIGVYNPEEIKELKDKILLWRELTKEIGIEEIFILASCNGKNIEKLNNMTLFNAFFDLSSYNSINPIKYQRLQYYFYSYLLYNNLNLNSTYNKTNCVIYRSSDIVSQYPITPKGKNIYSEYSPIKFNYLNKIIIEWTRSKYKNNRYIFINTFDNNYLDQKNSIGNESLYYLSSILNENPNKEKNYNLLNLENICLVAVQAHVFYDDLINEIIEKTNNIPVKFDLYITTDTQEKKDKIEDYVKNYTKANQYEILIVENRGRDVLPLLIQFKDLLNKYKYFCHIHTKKSGKHAELGRNWKNYLYGNLLGTRDIVSEILSDFENSDKLGLIFPPTYLEVLRYTIQELDINIKPLNNFLKKISPSMKAGKKIDFPAGNMFWARSKAVHQVFAQNVSHLCPKEPIKTDGTIMHAIERSWCFITKLNGYTYKQILKYF